MGREPELTRIGTLLTDARLVTLTGPGGAGKTRLAIEAADALMARSAGAGTSAQVTLAAPTTDPRPAPDVCFVELAPLTDDRHVGAYVLAGEPALAGGDFRTAFAEYETRIRDFAKGCQKISGNAGPFFAPATERRIRSRDRMYRVLASRPLARFFKRLTEKAATDIRLREYPALREA